MFLAIFPLILLALAKRPHEREQMIRKIGITWTQQESYLYIEYNDVHIYSFIQLVRQQVCQFLSCGVLSFSNVFVSVITAKSLKSLEKSAL